MEDSLLLQVLAYSEGFPNTDTAHSEFFPSAQLDHSVFSLSVALSTQ